MSYLLCLAAKQVSGFVLSFSLLYFLFSFLPLVNLIILFSNNPVLLLHEYCVDFQFCSNPLFPQKSFWILFCLFCNIFVLKFWFIVFFHFLSRCIFINWLLCTTYKFKKTCWSYSIHIFQKVFLSHDC